MSTCLASSLANIFSQTSTCQGSTACQSASVVQRSSADKDASGATRLRDTTQKVVGNVFYGTMLRALRASTLKGEYGHGGRGEEVFQAQLDQLLAEGAGQARKHDLVDVIVDRLAEQQRLMDERREAQAQERDNLDASGQDGETGRDETVGVDQ